MSRASGNARIRETGLAVELEVDGRLRRCRRGSTSRRYRIVQEALTNTLKHSGGARAAVTVRYCDDALELDIVDDGRLVSNGDSRRGHGITGMRERVKLFGGELEAGRRPEGGYAVHARLPLRA